MERPAPPGEPFFSYSIVDFDDAGLLWLEQRASEGGHAVLVRDGVEIGPPSFNARTRVHEYGGGAVWSGAGALFASSFDDGRVYRIEGRVGTPVTPEPARPHALRYADGCVADRTVTCVRETHDGEIVNELVSFPVG